MFTHSNIRVVLLLALFICLPSQVWADVFLVDPTGAISQVPWTARSKWVWVAAPEPKEIVPGFTLKEVPVFATEIVVPQSVGLKVIRGQPLSREEVVESSGVAYERWQLRSQEFPPHAHVALVEGSQKKKRELLVLSAPLEQLFILHESCVDLGVSWSSVEASDLTTLKSYLGAYCKDTGGSVLVAFIRPHSSLVKPKWKMRANKIPSAPGFDVYEIDKGTDPSPGKMLIGHAKIDSAKGASAQAKLSIERLKAYRRYSFNAGAGLTYLNYKEEPGGISASGFALSVKGGVHYHLIPKKLEIDASAFFNLLPMFYSVSGRTGSPRFWGVNMRAGYVLPRLENGLQFKVLAGPYAWGMMVPGSTYGVSSLFGGQLFGALEIPRQQWKKATVYLKFAPIGQNVSNLFSFNNYEVAVGGGYDLGNLLFDLPVHLMTDVSYFKVGKLVNSLNTISLTTVSLSLGVRL